MTLSADLCFRPAQIGDHTCPHLLAVMGTVYAPDVHTGGQEVAHKVIVQSRLARHGDHDAHVPGARSVLQEVPTITFKQDPAAADTAGRLPDRRIPRRPDQL